MTNLTKKKDWKDEFGNALKSLGLGMSGSQADFIFEWVNHILSQQKQELKEKYFDAIEESESLANKLKELKEKLVKMKREMSVGDFSGDTVIGEGKRAYNQALSDILKLL